MAHDIWNRCDVCGRFIALVDFNHGAARRLIYPDSALTHETWETLCREHARSDHEAQDTRPSPASTG
jgi:hypothetical protein